MKDFIIPDDRDMGTPARQGRPVTLTIDGQQVRVSSRRGSVEAPVRIGIESSSLT